MSIQLTLAKRYLAGRKLRTALTTLAIVFGVLVIFGMNSMLPAFVQAFQVNVQAASGQVDASITLKTGDAFDSSAVDKVAAIEGVRVVSGVLERTLNLPEDYYDHDPASQDAVSALVLAGIEPQQAAALHVFAVREGRFLEPGDKDAAVISQSLAEAVGLGLGDRLRLPAAGGEAELTIIGILPASTLASNERVLVTLSQAQALLEMPGKINLVEANFDSLDEARRSEIEAAILASLGDTFQFGSLASNSELLTNMKVAQAIFNILGLLALLMGGFIIFNTFRTIIAERRRDIGMLRALGANRRTILGVILAEGLVQGLVGTVLGLLAGYGLALLIIAVVNPIMRQFLNLQIGAPSVSPGLVILSALVGLGITLLAGLIPAISATRITPLEALRPSIGAVSYKRLAGIGFWSGVAMIALAAAALFSRNVGLIGLGGVLFVLGLILAAPALVNPIANLFAALLAVLYARSGTADLAQGNLSRQPGRAAITASTTLIAMAIIIMAAAMFSSVKIGFGQVMRKSLGSDYLLVPPSITAWGTNVGADPQLVDELRGLPDVEVVSTLRYAPSEAEGVAISVLGINPVDYPQVSGLTFSSGEEAEAYSALRQGRTVIINPVLATTTGVEVGDELEFITPTGRRSYRVAAVAGDYMNAKIATAYISQANIEADFNRYEDVLIQVNLNPQADRSAALTSFKSLLKAYPQFRLIDGQEFIQENLAIFNTAFFSIYILVIFLAIPSVIAMVNTLAIGIIERTREIGMLRAVGATRKQVRMVVLAEALILSGIGTAFGLLAGLYLGYMAVEAVRSAGFPMQFVFPASGVLIAVAAGILFGVAAAIIPARQAARLDIVTALHYE